VGVFLNGKAIPTPDSRGEPVVDDSFYLLFNAHHEALPFTLPTCPWGDRWEKVIDTNEPVPDLREHHEWKAGDPLQVEAYSLMVLRRSD
jgi:glycogen operon protein